MIIENILLYTFISISVIHIFYLLINWKFILSPETALVTKTDAVSVIICAKNEENTLPSLLKKLEMLLPIRLWK